MVRTSVADLNLIARGFPVQKPPQVHIRLRCFEMPDDTTTRAVSSSAARDNQSGRGASTLTEPQCRVVFRMLEQ